MCQALCAASGGGRSFGQGRRLAGDSKLLTQDLMQAAVDRLAPAASSPARVILFGS